MCLANNIHQVWQAFMWNYNVVTMFKNRQALVTLIVRANRFKLVYYVDRILPLPRI